MRLEIKQGILDGGEEKSLTTGKVFYTFMGIPYGEPPVAELRFRVSYTRVFRGITGYILTSLIS